MLLKQLLDKIDLTMEQADAYDGETDIVSITIIDEEKEQKPGVLYIGRLEQLPERVVLGTAFICCTDGESACVKTGCRNVWIVRDSFSALVDKVYMIFDDLFFIFGIMEKMMQAASCGLGLPSLLQTAWHLIGIPMFVTDVRYRPLAYNEGILAYPDFKEAVENHMLPENRISNINRPYMKEALRNYDDLYFMWAEADQEYILTSLIRVDSVETAHFLAYVGRETPLKYYKIVQFVCYLIALELQKTAFYQHNESVLENQFMKYLIEDTVSQAERESFREKLNWAEGVPRRILLLSSQGEKLDMGTARRAVRHLAEYLSEIHTVSYQGYYVVLCRMENQKLFEELPRILKRYHMICSVTAEFDSLSLVAQAYGQAVNALRYLLNGSFPGPLIRYQDCMYHIMSDELQKNCNIDQFLHPGVVVLHQDDLRNGTNLLGTLEAYLEFHSDPDAAAEAMHIHRNTLYYRINKIQAAYRLNLGSGRERLHILLTIEFLKARFSNTKDRA